MSEDMDRQRWHVGKEIPIALIFAMLVQSGALVAWGATQSEKLESYKQMAVVNIAAQQATDKRQDEELAKMEHRLTLQLDRITLKLDQIVERGRK